ncbi:ABC-F family ATP-binding cassette domain-containing protein [bacterium]|nr:ABC-F family ATP-binding cassette domain-containing protein [bacterium]
MNLLSVFQVSKNYGERTLFENVTFGVHEGQKIGLIGNNGSGKSTLLKILANVDSADSGTISQNNQITTAYLPQHPIYEKEETIIEHFLVSQNPKAKLIRDYETEPSDHLLEQMNLHNAWSFESDVKSILSALGITDLSMKMRELSGGNLKKVALAEALLFDADLLFLDEPTNHLDISSINWLQTYLQKSVKTLIMVTHDRYLLDNVCSLIFELDEPNLYRYEGNYEYYLDKKSEINEAFESEQTRIKSILRKELDWLKRGPCARGTKAKGRIQNIYKLIDLQQKDTKDKLLLDVKEERAGKKILELKNVSKSFGDKKVIHSVSYNFQRGERIGLVGDNGSGKTTFLNIITGLLEPDNGLVDVGINTKFGYFDQHIQKLNESQNIIDYIKDIAEFIELSDGSKLSASKMLERFLFPRNIHYSPIYKLSGGEKRRLYLLSVLMKSPNFLILDEPTNDLDINTLSVLEEFLESFKGVLVVVSHDRYFMDRTVDHLLVFGLRDEVFRFEGRVSDYLDFKQQEEKNSFVEQPKPIQKERDKPKEKTKLSFKEAEELKNIESLIEKLENEKEEIEKFFESGSSDQNLWKKNSARYDELKKTLDEKYSRWEYLLSFS